MRAKSLKVKKLNLTWKNLVLYGDLDKIKETLSAKEEAFVAELTKLENESLELKHKVESLLGENNKLLEKLK